MTFGSRRNVAVAQLIRAADVIASPLAKSVTSCPSLTALLSNEIRRARCRHKALGGTLIKGAI
jgi:hypothetical protein